MKYITSFFVYIVAAGLLLFPFSPVFAAVTTTITANGSSGGITVPAGTRVEIAWTSTGARSCQLSQNVSYGRWRRTGSFTTQPLTTAETYTIDCTGSDGGFSSASVSVNVTSSGSSSGSSGSGNTGSNSDDWDNVTNWLDVQIDASPFQIQEGQGATLTWNVQNAQSCTASGGWSGAKALSGSQVVYPVQDTSYTLTCTSPNDTMDDTVTVFVDSDNVFQDDIIEDNEYVNLEARNISAQESIYEKSVVAQGLDNIAFEIVIENTSAQTIEQARIRIDMPDQLFFEPTSTTIDERVVADGIAGEDGIFLGVIAPGEERVIRYRSVMFYGVPEGSTLTVEAVFTADGSIEEVSQAAIYVQNRGQVRGAADVSTGPEDAGMLIVLISFVMAVALYIVVYQLRVPDRVATGGIGRNVRLRAKVSYLRIKERNRYTPF